MWKALKHLFRQPLNWMGGMGDEINVKLHRCPNCDTPKAEQDFDLDDRWRVLCLDCRKQGQPRKAFEAYDDLVRADPTPPM